ncbi:MAG TPA: hypothetical protein VJP80_03195 [Candidatus Saccharimonadales bacterium]|nr:hypothetical protein [Candidatus Saccharimonadales bacterium]
MKYNVARSSQGAAALEVFEHVVIFHFRPYIDDVSQASVSAPGRRLLAGRS